MRKPAGRTKGIAARSHSEERAAATEFLGSRRRPRSYVVGLAAQLPVVIVLLAGGCFEPSHPPSCGRKPDAIPHELTPGRT